MEDQTPIQSKKDESFSSYLSNVYSFILSVSFICALIWLFIWANDVYDYMPGKMFWTLFLGILFGIILCGGFFFTIISIRKNLEQINLRLIKIISIYQEKNNNTCK